MTCSWLATTHLHLCQAHEEEKGQSCTSCSPQTLNCQLGGEVAGTEGTPSQSSSPPAKEDMLIPSTQSSTLLASDCFTFHGVPQGPLDTPHLARSSDSQEAGER